MIIELTYFYLFNILHTYIIIFCKNICAVVNKLFMSNYNCMALCYNRIILCFCSVYYVIIEYIEQTVVSVSYLLFLSWYIISHLVAIYNINIKQKYLVSCDNEILFFDISSDPLTRRQSNATTAIIATPTCHVYRQPFRISREFKNVHWIRKLL